MTPILLALAFIAILVIVFIIGQPDEFKVIRSSASSAPPEKLFPHVNDLHKWEAWSPWAKLDPNAKSTFAGPDAGVGAAMSWAGNNKVGEGRMTITESKPGESVRLRLEFMKPMQATNAAELAFKPEGGRTNITWTMTGENHLAGKVFGLFVNCDKMVGRDFEKGLASLKSVAEASARN